MNNIIKTVPFYLLEHTFPIKPVIPNNEYKYYKDELTQSYIILYAEDDKNDRNK
jgi:hypothetical protein